jgi:dipeptidyl aminopeptidase/acylaminoacyl peptidase
MNVRTLVSTLFVFALFSSALVVAQEPTQDESAPSLRSLQIDDTFKIKAVRSPSLSPDGKRLAYTVTTRDFDENSSKTRIWMMATKGGDPIPMTAEAVSSRAPTFSRDGKRLYFVSARNEGKSQIWFLDLVNGGEAQQLTDLDRGIGTINFSRDEK